MNVCYKTFDKMNDSNFYLPVECWTFKMGLFMYMRIYVYAYWTQKLDAHY